MAIDQSASTIPAESPATAAIENEFPTYRAISSTAILSLIFGVLSVFCYADLWFLLVVAAAVVLGLVSLRRIRRLPEVLTGAAFARLGIGIGLLFGLSALTQIVSQDILINIDAGQFARLYVGVLKDEPISVALWYQQSAEYRKTKNPDELVEELKKAKSPGAPDVYQEKSAPLQLIKDRLKGPGEEIHFSKVESKAIDGLTTYVNVLIELDGPGSPAFPEKEQFLLIQMMKLPNAGKLDWTVRELMFPYTPKSAIATVEKKVDDGHGH